MSYPPPTIEDLTQGSVSSNNASFTLTKPAGAVAGSFLLALIYTKRSGNQLIPTTVPSGWILITANSEASFGTAWAYYYKIATSSEPASYSWGSATSCQWAGGILVLSGVDQADPIGAMSTANVGSSAGFTVSVGPLERRNSLLIFGLLKPYWGVYGVTAFGATANLVDQLVSTGSSSFRGLAFALPGGALGGTSFGAFTQATNTEVNGYHVRGVSFELRGVSTRNLKVRDAGVWKDPSPFSVVNGGIWKEPEQVAVRDADIWKEAYA